MEGRFFSNINYRKAFQYLILKNITNEDLSGDYSTTMKLDSQIYLPFQKGSLSAAEVKAIIDEGKPFVGEFIEATNRKPLKVFYLDTSSWILDLLKRNGIKISKDSKMVEYKEILNQYYKSFEPDILPKASSVVSSDPDGVYHVLGKNGAITSPMIYNKKVNDLLEEGRKIVDSDEVHRIYQKVSRSVLSEVPILSLIHI